MEVILEGDGEQNSSSLPPDISRYVDYRAYLKDYYHYRKNCGVKFSFRSFAAESGFRSPNYMQLVMQGKRSLNEQTAARVAKALRLTAAERAFFVGLVRHQEAASPKEREAAQKVLLAGVRKLMSKEISRAQAEVLSRWHHLVVRELTFLKSFEANASWISRKLCGLISPKEAQASLEYLLKAGFLRVRENGKLEALDPAVDTGEGYGSQQVLELHRETLALWRDLMLRVSPNERELGLLNLPVARSNIPELKQKIRQFQDEIIGWVLSDAAPDTVVQLGTYLLPVTE